MTFIDSYESQLVEAAQRRHDARLRNRLDRRLNTPRRRALAVVLAGVIVAAPATAAGIRFNPFDDPGRDPRNPPPSQSTRGLDPDLTATLGVLRRPQNDADRGVATSRAARAFSRPNYEGVNLGGIRVVDPARGVVLVPFERTPVPTDPQGRPVPGFDPSTYTNAVCLFERSSDGFAGIGCHTADKIRAGRALATGSGRASGLVPDGVATVRLVRGAESTEAVVRDNYFSAESVPPQVVEWVGPDGAIVRRIDLMAPPPRP